MTEITPEMYDAQQMDQQLPEGFEKFAKLMIIDKKIPKEAQDDYWGFINKETILSRSGIKDLRRAENRFTILRNLDLMSKPYYKNDINKLKFYQNMQNRNTIEKSRSIDGFERQSLTTQIRQFITSQGISTGSNNGFWSGLKNKLGISGDEKRSDDYDA